MTATPRDGLPYDFAAERHDAEVASRRFERRIGTVVYDDEDVPTRAELEADQ